MKTQPTFHEIDEQHAALMRACSLPTYQELCNLNAELLAALQAVHAGFMDGSIKWAKPRQADSDPYHPANTLMTAAIAKATQS